MDLPKIKRYQKKFEYTYAFGTFPVIELLKKYPNKVLKVLLQSRSEGSEGFDEVIGLCKENNIAYEFADRTIERISVKENTYAVGVFKKYTSELDKDSNHLILVNPSNLGNIGTVIRTMLGFGFKNLGIIKPAGDIFDPSVIRSAMGAIFHINFEFFNNISEYTDKYPNQNIYTFMLDGAEDISNVSFKAPMSLIHGNESTGLSNEYKGLGKSVYIPHSSKIDSLNLSVAAAISIWEARSREKYG
jgi:TrmH family RNA methyltransferase